MAEAHSALVFGASGYVGSNLVPYLVEAGWRVRAAARSRAVLEARDWQGVDLDYDQNEDGRVNILDGIFVVTDNCP